MRFEWDERKNQSNIRKHGVAFDEAIEIFENEPLQYFDVDNSWDEDRYVAIGFAGMKILSVVFVHRGHGKIRIISARKASSTEERRYERGY